MRLNVRRLAALDMHGSRGTSRRRRVILAEFTLGTVGSLGLGVWALSNGGVTGVALGVWLVGLAANYLPLALYAVALSRANATALEVELAGADLGAELRRYTRAQIWVLVPFWIAGLALAQARRGN